jgi:hypothetical protein
MHMNRRRAVVAPFVAVVLVVLLSFVALAVDLGSLYHSTTQMQSAVDSAALAGASGLEVSSATAQSRALDYGGQNNIGQTALQNAETTVIIGHWEATSRTFTAGAVAHAVSPNAVQVIGHRTDMSLYFAHIMGHTSAQVQKDAIALAQSGFCMGVWGLEGISGAGSIYTDSYDASAGGYGGTNVLPNGDLCSGTGITLDGGVEIHGDTMYGNSHEIWGVIDDHCCPVTPPAFDIAAAMASNDNGTIPGCTNNPARTGFDNLGPWNALADGYCREIVLGDPGGAPRTYYFNSAEITGQGQVTVVGPTEIYLDGPGLFTGGGIINTTQDPRNLIIYSTDTTLNLSGNAGFYGVVVAPDADIVLEGTGTYYGMLVGKTLDIHGDSTIHVDEASVFDLLGLDGPAPTLVK